MLLLTLLSAALAQDIDYSVPDDLAPQEETQTPTLGDKCAPVPALTAKAALVSAVPVDRSDAKGCRASGGEWVCAPCVRAIPIDLGDGTSITVSSSCPCACGSKRR